MERTKSTNKKVAYQGCRGAFSEAAAKQYYDQHIDLVPLHSFDNVFDEIANNESVSGVLPIENSLTGTIHRNHDLLLKNDLWIAGETQVRVVHNLIAHPGVTIEEIRRVYSHPQGLSQCEQFLTNYPGIENVPAYDTAGSVKLIKENNWKDAAAIASRRAADHYEMQILVEGIEDNTENYTRFIILEKKHDIVENANKTSIVFSMANDSGSLFKCLSVFALRDISLSRIESRPLYGKPWQYFFYIDIEDTITSENCKNAINHLQEVTNFFRILGCYRSGLH